jgi:predicted nucleic acid-binding protein
VSEPKRVVIDTNILFSALLRSGSYFSNIIFDSGHNFFIGEATIVELFKHKERIVRLSKLFETEVVRLFYTILRWINVSKEALIEPAIRQRAYELCAEIDEADTPQVALTIHLDALLWTGDETLKAGLRQKGFDQFFDPSH